MLYAVTVAVTVGLFCCRGFPVSTRRGTRGWDDWAAPGCCHQAVQVPVGERACKRDFENVSCGTRTPRQHVVSGVCTRRLVFCAVPVGLFFAVGVSCE